jgi:hypothetical protein
MALLDVALAQANVVYVDTTTAPDSTDLADAGVLSADTTVYYGDGALDLTDILGANAISSGYTVATGGADLTFDTSLLDVSLLSSNTMVIDGDSSITLDAGSVSVASSVTNLLNKTTIAFSGSGDGTFTYVRPSIGLLSSTTLNVDEMGPGDEIVIPIPGDGIPILNPDAYTLREASNAWDGQHLTLVNGTGVNSVYVNISMTPTEYAEYSANPSAYLNANGEDTFTFPGSDDTEPPYEIPCFTKGTHIETPDGARLIEDLKAGDLVLTRDDGVQEILWIRSHKLSQLDIVLHPNLAPIRIKAGVLGNNRPEQDLMVSPQHRMLICSKIAERMFGNTEVLVAAKHLLAIDGIDVVKDLVEVEYFHMLFQQHEIVIANGAETESMYLGPQALKNVSTAGRDEIFSLFPELLTSDDTFPKGSRLMPKGRQARHLIERHIKNQRSLVV